MNITHLRQRKIPAIVAGLALLLSSIGYGGALYAADAPVITTASFSSSTTPITLQGTAATGTTITVMGGTETETVATAGDGTWSLFVDLNLNAINNLEVTATDASSTSATSTVAVTHDNTAAVFGTTTDVTATATSSSGTIVNYTAPTTTDNLDTSVSVVCNPAAGTNFAVGTTTVNCTATDDAGNTATADFDVIVSMASTTDTVAPVFGTTTDVMATATTSAGVIVNFTVTAVDDVDGSVPVICDPASGSLFAVGTTSVDCTAMDNASNTATTTFDVIVDLDEEATTTPNQILITHPIFASGLYCATSTPVLLEGTTNASSTVTIVGGLNSATTTSNGSGAWSTVINLTSNATSSVVVTVFDSGDNAVATTTLNFAFDTTAPTITLNGDANVSLSRGGTFTDAGVTVSDNLDADVATSTSGTVDVNTAGTYTITYTATDCAGNTASVERTVTVNGSSSGGSGRRRSVPPGLLVAVENASPNSAVAFVLAGQVEGRADGQVLGLSIGQFLRDLRRGDRGQDVAELQARLFSTGIYEGPITGYFGNMTAAAVRALQRGLNIPATGNFDASTRAVINNS
jgi:hypothetical protein